MSSCSRPSAPRTELTAQAFEEGLETRDVKWLQRELEACGDNPLPVLPSIHEHFDDWARQLLTELLVHHLYSQDAERMDGWMLTRIKAEFLIRSLSGDAFGQVLADPTQLSEVLHRASDGNAHCRCWSLACNIAQVVA